MLEKRTKQTIIISKKIVFVIQLSKAAMLQKGAEYIKQLRSERTSVSEEMDRLRKEIETLTNSLKLG